LQSTRERLQGRQVEKLQDMYQEGIKGKGGVGAGGFF
jgi:hypothetical protein